MLEFALRGSRGYWIWVISLAGVVSAGFGAYLYQFHEGLTVTGLSRDVSWGLYIAQLTFLVGVAASAVLLVLPYYLHNYKVFGRITVLGEFMAVVAVNMCMLFVLVDLGNPVRLLNIFLYPTPNSILFWDASILMVYLLLNIVIGWTALASERKQTKPPTWVKPLIYLSIPWAISIHTVTAFLYAGLPARHLWLTAVMAPRFLASAFAAGPALLILLSLLLRRVSTFDAGNEAIRKLTQIMTYAMIINLFLIIMEFFTAFYSNIPDHMRSLTYLYMGLEGKTALVPWMWVSSFLGIVGVILLLTPAPRRNERVLAATSIIVFISLWIDKGMGLVIGGFIPNPMEKVAQYAPTAPEIIITIGVYALGALILSALYKIAVSVKREAEA